MEEEPTEQKTRKLLKKAKKGILHPVQAVHLPLEEGELSEWELEQLDKNTPGRLFHLNTLLNSDFRTAEWTISASLARSKKNYF